MVPSKLGHLWIACIASQKHIVKIAQLEPSASRQGMLDGRSWMVEGMVIIEGM